MCFLFEDRFVDSFHGLFSYSHSLLVIDTLSDSRETIENLTCRSCFLRTAIYKGRDPTTAVCSYDMVVLCSEDKRANQEGRKRIIKGRESGANVSIFHDSEAELIQISLARKSRVLRPKSERAALTKQVAPPHTANANPSSESSSLTSTRSSSPASSLYHTKSPVQPNFNLNEVDFPRNHSEFPSIASFPYMPEVNSFFTSNRTTIGNPGFPSSNFSGPEIVYGSGSNPPFSPNGEFLGANPLDLLASVFNPIATSFLPFQVPSPIPLNNHFPSTSNQGNSSSSPTLLPPQKYYEPYAAYIMKSQPALPPSPPLQLKTPNINFEPQESPHQSFDFLPNTSRTSAPRFLQLDASKRILERRFDQKSILMEPEAADGSTKVDRALNLRIDMPPIPAELSGIDSQV